MSLQMRFQLIKGFLGVSHTDVFEARWFSPVHSIVQFKVCIFAIIKPPFPVHLRFQVLQ